MAYVDLMVGAVVLAVGTAFMLALASIWSAWKEDTAKAGLLKDEVAPQNQQPRAVGWEEFDALRNKVAELEKWACADHDHDQQIRSAVNTLDRKIGKRFCVKWTEEFTTHNTEVDASYVRTFVWGEDCSMTEKEAWSRMDQMKKDSEETFCLVLVWINGRATLITSAPKISTAGTLKHTYWVEEVKI